MLKLRVRDVRISLSMTQKQLADELGVSQSYISKLEREGFLRENPATLETVENLARVFRCCPSLLIERDCDHCCLLLKEDEKRDCKINTSNQIINALKKVE